MSESGILTFGNVLPIFLVIFTVWTACLYTYRLTLHPLAKFPGPKLAAATRFYEFYYDVVLQGHMVFHLPELHKIYGPIVRISPEELHIDDPDFFDVLYTRSGRLHKHARDQDRFGNPHSVFVTADADLHRLRRTALNPFFSRRNVVSLQHFVHDKVDQMLGNIATFRGTGKPLTLSLAYMALSGDVIMEFCFGYNFNHVDSAEFKTNFHEVLLTASQSGNLAVHFPIVMKIIMRMPEWFVIWGTPLFALLFKLQHSVERDVKELRQQETIGETKNEATAPTIIQHLMRSDLPPPEKTDLRLRDEGQNFVGAGVSTTGWALSVASFHIINNRKIYHKVRKELEDRIPDLHAADALEWSKLEKCEYLTACIKEGIRLACGPSNRLTRLSDSVIQYRQWQIPPKTPVGMCLVDLYHNEDIFPEPGSFKPERWLGDARTGTREPLEKYWFGFMRGNRSCLGINLAWLESYVALAGIFRSFDFELFETDESDVALKHDFVVPAPKLDSKGVRVLVK